MYIVVSNTYCVVFLFCLSSSCVPYFASFSGFSIFECPFGILKRLFTVLLMLSVCILITVFHRVSLFFWPRGGLSILNYVLMYSAMFLSTMIDL